MQMKIISIMLVIASLLCFTASCGGTGENAYDIAPLDSEYAGTVDNAYTFDEAGISEGLYSYIYNYYKQDDLEYYQQFVDYMGSLSATEADNIAVEDTEKFWTAGVSKEIRSYIVSEGDDKDYTYGDILTKRVDTNCKTFLAYEALANQYGYNPETDFEGYSDKLSAAMIEAIKASEIYDKGMEVADSNGVLYEWVTDRWEVYLASYGITYGEWVRYFFNYTVVMSDNLIPWLIDNGHVLPDERESAIEDLKDYLKDYFEQIKSTYVKFEYIQYGYVSEKEFNEIKGIESKDEAESSDSSSADESSEESKDAAASEDNSAEGRTGDASAELSGEESSSDAVEEESSEEASSDDTSSDSDADGDEKEVDPLVMQASTYEEYKKLLQDKCKAIYDGVKDGSLDFKEQIKACPTGADILEKNPNGAYASHEYYKSFFGKEASEVKIGEIEMFLLDGAIYILHYLDFDEKDMSTEPTDEDIETWLEYTAEENCMEKVSELEAMVKVNSALVEGYSKPWEIEG